MNSRNVSVGLILLALLFVPVAGPYWVAIGIAVFLNVILASTVRLCLVTKMFNCATAAVMAIGAYTSALLVVKAGMPFELAIICAAIAGGLLSIIVGYPALRLTGGLYFGMVTIALVEVVRMVLSIAQPLTNGTAGLRWIPRPTLAGFSMDNDASLYYMALGLLALTLFVLYRLDNSRFGMIWRAIGQSESLARSVGVNLALYKTAALLIASVFVALAGAFSAHYVTFLSPNSFAVMISLYPLLYAWVGGQKSFLGPIVGAVFLTVLSEPFRGQGQWESVFHSTVLLLAVLLLPGGLVSLPQRLGALRSSLQRRRRVDELATAAE